LDNRLAEQQLVFQFSPWGSDVQDFDRLVRLEDQLIEALAGQAEVDGHDMGSNEANVFVFAHDAPESFFKCLTVIERSGLLALLAAGYRDVDHEVYTNVWPKPRTTPFSTK